MFNLKGSGHHGDRFHDTLSYEIDRREKEFHAQKLKDFQEYVNSEQSLNDLFDFVADNMWFRDEPKLIHMHDMLHDELVQLAKTDWSHDALFYLAEIYGIYLQAEYDEDDDWMIEYIIDLNGKKHIV